MRKIIFLFSFLILLSTCKKDEDTSVLVNASVANSSEGSVDFKSGDYSIGSSVTFSATPKTGYVFTNWTDTNSNQTYTSNPLSITVNENTTLVANFEKVAYNVLFTISGDGSVQKEVVGGGGYTHGSQVKLTATPSDDYSFFYWNNDPGDTENPKTITLDSNQNIPAKFDYEVARNLVGNWEFEISDPASKNVTIIKMSIDIFLNVLMTTVVNGEVISEIFTQMVAISSTAIVIGDFAVITDVVVASASSLSMNMVSIPENTAPPTNESEIPDTGSELNLAGNKSDEEPETDEYGIIIPPTDAVTASSTTQDIGAIFEDSFDKLAGLQSSTLSSNTLNTGTTSSTDVGDDSAEQQTFLERYNGVGFADDEEYFFFNDDDVLIKYVFVSNENGNECSEIKEGSNTVDGDTFTLRIVTNTYNRLKIEMTGDGEINNVEFVPTADGNSLFVYDDGDDDESYYVVNKTTDSFASLCADAGTTSSTDVGDDSAEQQTFLERYNGVGFADDEEYFFFNDDDVLIKYVFVSNENGNECSEIKEGSNTVDGDTFTLRIVTNTYNRLKIEMTGDGEINNVEFVPTADGNSLFVYDDGDDDESYYVVNKTTDSFASLCADAGTTSSTSSDTTSAKTYAINVTASNASNYTLSGADRNGDVTGNDPSVTINVGDTVDFAVDASGHPFYLKTTQGTGTGDLISGVTNNGATNGTVSWTPSAAGTYYYQCSLHNGMYGTITVN